MSILSEYFENILDNVNGLSIIRMKETGENMQVYEKLARPIKEVNYLRAENAERYRVIIRFFFKEYEKLHNWMHKEDVFEMMKSTGYFENYTMEQCQLDLQSLVDWGNLTAMQDSNKVRTIADFKNKKYRYQLSEYTVEIERMTMRLENIEVEGASLEPTLLDRIYQQLIRYDEIKTKSDMDIHGWLQLLMNDFVRLNQNYQGYINMLNSAKAEELMKTTEFLVFKDKLITYLRTFVMMMQEKGGWIATYLQKLTEKEMEDIFSKATAYELTIPRLDTVLVYDDVYENFVGRWQSFYRWFIAESGLSEMDRLYDITNEIIRKITRFAQQIVEMSNRGSNRKEQYFHLVDIFGKCKDINEAHCLSAYVFGVEDCRHLDHIQPRMTEDIHRGVYEENPSYVQFEPHSKIARKKYVRKPAKDYGLEKQMTKLEMEQKLEEERQRIASLTVNDQIRFSELPIIPASTRKILLMWLTKALGQANHCAKTDDGKSYQVIKKSEASCVLRCEDGDFVMPDFQIVFKEKQ